MAFGLTPNQIDDAHRYQSVRIDRIVENLAPVRSTDESEFVETLSVSIQRHGQLAPICVKQIVGRPTYFELVAGRLRLEAARRNGEPELWAIVLPPEADAEEIRLFEQLHRKSLHPIDEARALWAYKAYSGCSNTTLAGRLGISVSHLTSTLALAQFSEEIRSAILEIKPAPAREVLIEMARARHASTQGQLLSRMRSSSLTRDQARALRRTGDENADVFGVKLSKRLLAVCQMLDIQDANLAEHLRERVPELLQYSRQIVVSLEKMQRRNVGAPTMGLADVPTVNQGS